LPARRKWRKVAFVAQVLHQEISRLHSDCRGDCESSAELAGWLACFELMKKASPDA